MYTLTHSNLIKLVCTEKEKKQIEIIILSTQLMKQKCLPSVPNFLNFWS